MSITAEVKEKYYMIPTAMPLIPITAARKSLKPKSVASILLEMKN